MNKKNDFVQKSNRIVYLKLTYIFLLIAYFFFFIRYLKILPYIPILFSLDDIFWEMGIIFFLKFIFMKRNIIFNMLAISVLIIMLCEESIQKFTLNDTIVTTTFSYYDLLFYILGYIFAIIIIFILNKKNTF